MEMAFGRNKLGKLTQGVRLTKHVEMMVESAATMSKSLLVAAGNTVKMAVTVMMTRTVMTKRAEGMMRHIVMVGEHVDMTLKQKLLISRDAVAVMRRELVMKSHSVIMMQSQLRRKLSLAVGDGSKPL